MKLGIFIVHYRECGVKNHHNVVNTRKGSNKDSQALNY